MECIIFNCSIKDPQIQIKPLMSKEEEASALIQTQIRLFQTGIVTVWKLEKKTCYVWIRASTCAASALCELGADSPRVAATVSRLSVSLPCCDWDINLIHVYTVLPVSRLAVNHTELGRVWHLLQPATWTHHRRRAQGAAFSVLCEYRRGQRKQKEINKAGGYKGGILGGGGGRGGCWGGGRQKEKRWMATGKCHSLNILTPAPFPLLPLSLRPSLSSCLSSSHLSLSLPHSLYLPLLPSLCCLLREAASVCFSLSRFLIRRQWKESTK